MTAMAEDVDDRFAGIDIDSLLNRTQRRPFSYGRKKTLYEAPEFIQRLNGEETVLEGQSLCIECKVAGFPAPSLRWFKDDEEILDHPRIHVESNGKGGYCLMIDNVNKGDEAAYRCRAENVEGASSCCFFLSVKGQINSISRKPKSPKKKDGKSPNRRTVSFPPMFATIVEKVEEEEKQGKELKDLPPSPMTEFYYALTLKSRQSWPTFVGDWAFVDGDQHEKRRTDYDERETKSAPTTPVSNGDVTDKNNLFLNKRDISGKGVNRGMLKEMTKETRQRLDEEAAKREKENAVKRDQEKVVADKKKEEENKKLEAEKKIEEEQRKREDAMKLRRKTREERRERERKIKEEEERKNKHTEDKIIANGTELNRINDKKTNTTENKESLGFDDLKRKNDIRMAEEEGKRKEREEVERKSKAAPGEEKKKETGLKEKDKTKTAAKLKGDKSKEEEKRNSQPVSKVTQQISEIKRLEDAKQQKLNKDNEMKRQEEERQLKLKKESDMKRQEEERRLKLKKESDMKRLEEERLLKLKKESDMKRLEEERQLKLKKENDMKRIEEERQLKLKKESDMKRQEEERQLKLKKENDMKRIEEERQLKLKKESDMKRQEEERQLKLKKESDMKRQEEERQLKIKRESDIKRQEEEKQQKLKKENDSKRHGIEGQNKENDVRRPLTEVQKSGTPVSSLESQSAEKLTLKRGPAALHVFKDKESNPANTREKSPLKPNQTSSLLSQKTDLQSPETQQSMTHVKAADTQKDTRKFNETLSDDSAHELKYQLKDNKKSLVDSMRQREKEQIDRMKQREQQQIDSMKQREQQQIDSMKQREQQQIDSMKQREQQQIDSMKQREQQQIDKLKERERQQISALRQREQTQIDALRQKEKEQIDALRKRQQNQNDAVGLREKLENSGKKENEQKTSGGDRRLDGTQQDSSEREKKSISQQREDLKSREQKQIVELRAKEQSQRDALRLKERQQIDDLHRSEEQQKNALRLLEMKVREDMRSKQSEKQVDDEARRNEVERLKIEQKAREIKEEKQMDVRKEQIRREQLRRQYEEETRKRQEKLKSEDDMRRSERERAVQSRDDGEQEGETKDEHQIKVHKRDYSFSELRQSLESHLGGDVMDEEEHKYWDNIMKKHSYSINDIKKAFDSISNEERSSRPRARRNSIEETELLKMKRSSSINDLRESYTKSLGRPKKKLSDIQKRQKDEEFLKRASSISDLRQQFLEVVQKQSTSSRLLNVPGKQEAEITIRHMKLSETVRPSEIRQRSKSPTPSPVYVAGAQSPTQNSLEIKPASRTQAELTKLAGTVAAKRASFHEMLSQKGENIISEKSQKRMSYHGRDVYGSREISVYKRAAGWSDDIGNGTEMNDPQLSSSAGTQASNASSSFSSGTSHTDTISSSYTTKVRPFVYNSVRTTARNSTGSIASETYNYSSDEDVFTEDSSDSDADAGDVKGKPHFYFDDESDSVGGTKNGSVADLIIYNSNAIVEAAFEDDGLAAFVENSANNNIVLSRAGAPEDKSIGVGKSNLNVVKNLQNKVSLEQTAFDTLNSSTKAFGTPGVSLPHATSVSPTQQGYEPFQTKRRSEDDMSLIISNEANMAQNSNKVMSAEIHAKGDRTPPIIVEMWDEVEEPRSPTLKSSESMRVASTSRNACSLFVTGYAREEREPTPFLKESDQSSQILSPFLLGVPMKNSGHSDNARVEREPTPFFDERTRELNTTRDLNFHGQISNRDIGNHKEFQRELTPFYDKKAIIHTPNTREETFDSNLGLNNWTESKGRLQTSKNTFSKKGFSAAIPSLTAPVSSSFTAALETGGVINKIPDDSGMKEASLKSNSKSLRPCKDKVNVLNSNQKVGVVALKLQKVKSVGVTIEQHTQTEAGSRRDTNAPPGNPSERRSRSETRQDRRQTVVQEITVEAPRPRALSVPRDTSPTIAKVTHEQPAGTFSSKPVDIFKTGLPGQSGQIKQEKCRSKKAFGSNQTKTPKVSKTSETITLHNRESPRGEGADGQAIPHMGGNELVSGKVTHLKIPTSTQRNKKSPDNTVENGEGKSRRNVKSNPDKTSHKSKTTISSRLKKTMKGLLPQTLSDKASLSITIEPSTAEQTSCSEDKDESLEAADKNKPESYARTTPVSSEARSSSLNTTFSQPKYLNEMNIVDVSSACLQPLSHSVTFTRPPTDTNMPTYRTVARVLPNQHVTPRVVQQEDQLLQTETRPKDSKLNFLTGVFTALFKSSRRTDPENLIEFENTHRRPENKKVSKRRKRFAKDRSKSKSNDASVSSDVLPQGSSGPDDDGRASRPTPNVDWAKCSPFGRHTVEGMCFLFVMTMFCLSAQMPVEKFVCYVLASFYTFCVLRVLGLVG